MRLNRLLFLIGCATACNSVRDQSSDSGRGSKSAGGVGVVARSATCDAKDACASWVIATPEMAYDVKPVRLSGSYRTVGERGSVHLDSVVGRTPQGPVWAPVDSVLASLNRGERFVAACGLRGHGLDGRIVAVVRETSGDSYPAPRLAWRFDTRAARILVVSPDSVYCEREYAGE